VSEPGNDLVFWGAGGQAKVLRECCAHTGGRVVALFDNQADLISPFAGVPLHTGRAGFEAWLTSRPAGNALPDFLVAIGGDRGRVRVEIQEYLEAQGLRAAVARHPTAFVAADARVGAGAQVLANASVCVEAVLGRGCIVNTAASVDHECRLGEGVHLCPGARLAGCVTVEPFATIGTGAGVLPRLCIGEGAFVGAGAVVTRNVEPFTIVVGNPARILRRIENHG